MLGHAITPVPASRPFHRNSTLEEAESTRTGRIISELAVRYGLKRASVEFPDPDDATIAMVRASVREGPLRGAVLFSGGALSFEALDLVLEVLNGEWSAARQRVGKRRSRRR